jgi:ABC-type bacteriocin/lantibiotic exporter with double-glycine peptidase domain
MCYVKNFEPPSQRYLVLPFVILLIVIIAVVSVTAGMTWLAWCAVMLIVCAISPILGRKEHEPIRKAETEYLEYLQSCSLREMVKLVNDPSRPYQTKHIVRYHLDLTHPGWHEQVDVTAPAQC